MTDEALIVRIKRVINEVNKRPQLDFFFKVNPLLQEYKNASTKSSSEKLLTFSKKEFKNKEEFLVKFEEVIK